MLAILQWTNTTLVISESGLLSSSLSIVTLFLVLHSIFIFSGIKSSR